MASSSFAVIDLVAHLYSGRAVTHSLPGESDWIYGP
jgi:hypothetical protein